MTNIHTFTELDEIFEIYCRDKDVVDIGSMSGTEHDVFPTDKLKRVARSLTCVDANKNPKIDITGIEFVQSRIEDFETPKKFQTAFCGEIIEHIAQQETFLLKVKSLLTPDGRLIITTPNSSAISDIYRIMLTGADLRQDAICAPVNGVYVSGHVLIHNIATLQQLFDSVGMIVTDAYYRKPVGGNLMKQLVRDAILQWRPQLSSQIVVVGKAR